MARILLARAVLADSSTWLEGGGLLVGRGRVLALYASRSAARRAARGTPALDLGEHVLTSGLVNAHAHLELSGLAGRLDPGSEFGAWVRRLLELRSQRGRRELCADSRRGARRCLATGTTLVGDLDTTGGSERGLAGLPLRVRLFREVLDAHDPARTAAALLRVRRALPRRARRTEGIAPHAPYSASPALLASLGRLARRRGIPVSVHWSETRAELDWLEHGRGPLAALLGPAPAKSGLDLLAEAGLLGPTLALVHGNHPHESELARIASAGVTLVHCPGSHAWFGREPFPLARYLRAGVRLALGTDSLASNEDLDLLREVSLLRRAHPALAPSTAWRMATEEGARALGHAGRAGVLLPGAFADAVAWQATARTRPSALEELTSGAARVARIWVGGREVPLSSGASGGSERR